MSKIRFFPILHDCFWHKADILLRSATSVFGGKADIAQSSEQGTGLDVPSSIHLRSEFTE
jgi:hypothetical protein